MNAADAGELTEEETVALKKLCSEEDTKAFANKFKVFNKKWLSVPLEVKKPLSVYNSKLPVPLNTSSESVRGEVDLARLDDSIAVTDPQHEDTKALFRLMGSLTAAQGLLRDERTNETREGLAKTLRNIVVDENIPIPTRLLSMMNGYLPVELKLNASYSWE